MEEVFISFTKLIDKFHETLEIMAGSKESVSSDTALLGAIDGDWKFTADQIRIKTTDFTITILKLLIEMPGVDVKVMEDIWAYKIIRVVKFALFELKRFDLATTLTMGLPRDKRILFINNCTRRFRGSPEILGFCMHLLSLVLVEDDFYGLS